MKVQKVLVLFLLITAHGMHAVVKKNNQSNSGKKNKAVLEHSLKAERCGAIVKMSTTKLLYKQQLRRVAREKSPMQRA